MGFDLTLSPAGGIGVVSAPLNDRIEVLEDGTQIDKIGNKNMDGDTGFFDDFVLPHELGREYSEVWFRRAEIDALARAIGGNTAPDALATWSDPLKVVQIC